MLVEIPRASAVANDPRSTAAYKHCCSELLKVTCACVCVRMSVSGINQRIMLRQVDEGVYETIYVPEVTQSCSRNV